MATSLYYLQNETGARRSLNLNDEVFLTNVSGLGVTLSNSTAPIDFGFYNLTKVDYPQEQIVGDLVFRDGAFENYKTLINWILSANELFFVYNPGDDEYYKRVKLSYITKSARSSAGWARMPIAFDGLTPWYLPTPLVVSLGRQDETAMTYPYAYDDDLHYGSSNIGNYTAEIIGGGHMDAAISVKYTGAAENPVISLSDGTNVIGNCAISATLSATDTLEFNTSYRDSEVKIIHSGGYEESLINNIDITSNPWIRIPLDGRTYTLRLSADNELNGVAEVLVYQYYRSV